MFEQIMQSRETAVRDLYRVYNEKIKRWMLTSDSCLETRMNMDYTP